MRSQRIGHGFESRYLHHKQRKSNRLVRLFSCLRRGYKGHLTRGACCACRHAARDRANGLVISASLSRQRSLKGESRYLHHAYGSVFMGPFFYFCVVEMKGTSHPWGMLCMPPRCTLAQTQIYANVSAFRVRSLKGESRYLHQTGTIRTPLLQHRGFG